MEGARNLVVMHYRGRWSDLGSWHAIWQESAPDESGNVVMGNSLALDCERTFLRSEKNDMAVVGVGLHDVVTVATADAVLVVHASEAQRVKQVAQQLKAKGVWQAIDVPSEQRPWGCFETLANSSRYHVKRISVGPGAALSLQSHRHRAEHWVVVEGIAKVAVEDTVQMIEENGHVLIPLGAIHRLENPSVRELILIDRDGRLLRRG